MMSGLADLAASVDGDGPGCLDQSMPASVKVCQSPGGVRSLWNLYFYKCQNKARVERQTMQTERQVTGLL